ncbi:hypothetical protein CDL15_Pgr007095 [Punica granatum]|nr:hypothetical protein CDL15_Pgr007095 [Punica granatum]PKI65520.1 hypothetical protein CRG98_014020 [Punica granatum]
MAADVSSLARYLNGYRTVGSESAPEKSTVLITRDLLGGGPIKVESEELDLDLHVPVGWEKRLDLKSGKVYIQRCGAPNLSSDQRTQAKLQDLNSPTSPSKLALSLFDEPSLDLKLVSSSPSSSSSSSLSLPFNYQSVCTLDKVKSALERAEREPTKRRSPFWKALQSPSCSSSSSCNKDVAREQEKDEMLLNPLSSPVATGCASCLAYVLVSESNPKCPRCNLIVPLPKKARIDLNMSI